MCFKCQYHDFFYFRESVSSKSLTIVFFVISIFFQRQICFAAVPTPTCPFKFVLNIDKVLKNRTLLSFKSDWFYFRIMCSLKFLSVMVHYGLINYKDIKTKCRLYWCLIEFIDWRYSQSCWYFRPSFVNYLPANLLSGSPPPPPPPPPLPKGQSTVYTDSVRLGRGGSPWVGGCCVEDHILQEFNTLFLIRFRTYKIALPPQTKT